MSDSDASTAELDSTPLIKTHPRFDAADADFTIRVTLSNSSPPTRTDYRVHSWRLAAASPVFADMLELGKSSKAASDAFVEVESKHAPVWETLLDAVYGDHRFFEEPAATRGKDYSMTLRGCWHVAYKYQIKVAQLQSDYAIKEEVVWMPSCTKNVNGLIKLYEKAKTISSSIVSNAVILWLSQTVVSRRERQTVVDQLDKDGQNQLMRLWLFGLTAPSARVGTQAAGTTATAPANNGLPPIAGPNGTANAAGVVAGVQANGVAAAPAGPAAAAPPLNGNGFADVFMTTFNDLFAGGPPPAPVAGGVQPAAGVNGGAAAHGGADPAGYHPPYSFSISYAPTTY